MRPPSFERDRFDFRCDPALEAVRAKAVAGLSLWRGECPMRRPSDPGDFGAGPYWTTSAARARTYAGSSGVLRRVSAVFAAPLVLDAADAYGLAERYGTLHGSPEARKAAALTLAEDLRQAGHDALIAVHRHRGRAELEVVDLREGR